MDEESGLIYMKARYYDPVLGMFLNQDSFEGSQKTPPSLHKYLYAAGNPVIYVDADGNFFILGGMADELANRRNQTLDAADSFSNQGALRGAQRVSAGAGGIGAGVFGLLEGGIRVLNYAGNAAIEGVAKTAEFAGDLAGVESSGNTLSESYFVKSAREEFAASNAAIGKAYETIKENPKAVGTAIASSVTETGAGIIDGDPGAIARGVSTITEVIGGGGVAGVTAKASGQMLKVAANGVKKVADKTGEIARKAVDNLSGGHVSGSLRAQRGAAGVEKRGAPKSGVKWNNGWRTADGKFASPNGTGRGGAAAEQSVWDAVKQKPGWNVIEGQVGVRNASGQLRYYDGAAVSPRGRVIGLEVKSGSATKTLHPNGSGGMSKWGGGR